MHRSKQNSSKPKHCKHCTGNFGRCACTNGCKPTDATKCSAVSKHCHHCSGNSGDCSCSICPAKPNVSQCIPKHSGISCTECHVTSIRGPRYQCLTDSMNYCVECYYGGNHDPAHAFRKFERPPDAPAMVPPLIAMQHPRPTVASTTSTVASDNSQHHGLSEEKRQISLVLEDFGQQRANADSSDQVTPSRTSRMARPSSRRTHSPPPTCPRPPRAMPQQQQQERPTNRYNSPNTAPQAADATGPSSQSSAPMAVPLPTAQATEAPIPMVDVDNVVPVVETLDGSSFNSVCNFKVGQVLRLQGLSKMSMNGRFGIVEAITANEKVVLKVKGHTVPVVVSGHHLTEAFPVDTVVLLPDDQKPGVVVGSLSPRKISVLVTELGEVSEFEPEQLTTLEELM